MENNASTDPITELVSNAVGLLMDAQLEVLGTYREKAIDEAADILIEAFDLRR